MVLADGEEWAFPISVRPFTNCWTDLEDLAAAIVEADGEPDRSLALLAFAIFLLRLNYDLEPEAMRRLLTFQTGSPEEAAWRRDMAEILTVHLSNNRPLDARSDVSEACDPRRPFGWLARWADRWRPLLSSRR